MDARGWLRKHESHISGSYWHFTR